MNTLMAMAFKETHSAGVGQCWSEDEAGDATEGAGGQTAGR